MSLTAEEIAALVAEGRPLLEGTRVDNVHQTDGETVFLSLYSRSAGKLFLLLSTRPRLMRFHLVAERSPSPAAPLPFCETARARLAGAWLEGIRQVSGDRVLEAAFRRRGAGEQGEEVFLVLEMIGGRGELILVGARREILASLHGHERGGRDMSAGSPYRFPGARPQPAQLRSALANPWTWVGGDEAALSGGPAPLHGALGRRYAVLEEKYILEEKRQGLEASLRRELVRRERLVEKVKTDLARLEGAKDLQMRGELLKGALGRLSRGMSSIEVEDWSNPAGGTVQIPLDPSLGPRANLERIFARARKSRRAVPILEERLGKVEAERERVQAILEELPAAATLDALVGLEEAAKGLVARRGAGRRVKGAPVGPLGPRRFLSADGIEILVGRNAKKNDELTFRMARGNDIFLHVSERPGAHVIVRSVPGKSVPLETLLDAAELALYYSLPERNRTTLGARASATVDYAPVKHVKKPKGARAGLVLLAGRKTLRVSLEPERLERLRRSAAGENPSAGGEGAET
ncbi:MAG TPA: NFACT family protein [Planctomycetota bacterium]|nr:NFACT family protein [Planctomycetota bacterium]